MKEKSSILKKVGFASFIMMASVFASRIIGLAREIAIAFAGGAGGDVDAYQVSFIIPEILNHIVASGFLSITFIPIFSAYLARKEEEEGWRIFSIIFNTFGILLLVFIAFSAYFAPDLVTILAPGLVDDPAIFQKAVKMTRIIIPAQFFFFSGGLFMSVQFAKERFLIPALAPLLYNIGIITAGILLSPWTGMEGFAWGVLIGSFTGNFLLQYFGAKKAGMKWHPIISLKHPELIKYILLTLPLMLGLTMTFSTEIFLKYFGSFLEEGSIAALNYALRIMFILVGLFGQAVGVASYPFMAKLAARGDIDQLNQLLNKTLKFLLLVIPFSVLFMVLRHEIVLILFQRGQFDLQATMLTAEVLPFFMAGTFAFAGQTVVVRGYYAIQNTWFPALFGTLSVLFTLPLFYILMNFMEARGVALALSVAAMIQVSVLFFLWNRKTRNHGAKTVYLFFLKISLLSTGMGIILCKITNILQNNLNEATFAGSFTICAITGTVFMLLFACSGFFFKIEEISILMND
ncbi:MAG: murein biosynthesis integral membrane protein MurJ, partial [Thermodesulfobacteriota bacterium]|nr:murein biosynthesis integral membrane protein MurJ [Thermodesulfobacteriota bacterium]